MASEIPSSGKCSLFGSCCPALHLTKLHDPNEENTRCVKCGFLAWQDGSLPKIRFLQETHHHVFYSADGKLANQSDELIEYLRRECKRCGFVWQELCVDVGRVETKDPERTKLEKEVEEVMARKQEDY